MVSFPGFCWLMSRIVANRYEIEDEIGRGGMAVVYRARDMRLNRRVALKILHPFLATQTESAARFLREAEAIAKLHHPNIVEIFDTGQDEETGSHFLVMELLDGVTLTEFIHQHPTAIPEIAIVMGCSLCDAIDHAHKANIIHRDIKPENIMFSGDGVLKLMDFGIARILDAEKMTASGSLIGSPAHMAPEIIEGHQYSYSCDIFSLGTVLYFALTNALPFQGTTPMAVFKAILDNRYSPPSRLNLSISKKIDRLVARCLKTDPAERYQSTEELKAALLEPLSIVDMSDYGEVISKYYANPEAFNTENIPRIVGHLNDSAQLAVKEHRLPNALETLNTILTYDPANEQAAALLKKLRTGSQIKKKAIIAGVIGALLAISIILFYALPVREIFASSNQPSVPVEQGTQSAAVQPVQTAESDVEQKPTGDSDAHSDEQGTEEPSVYEAVSNEQVSSAGIERADESDLLTNNKLNTEPEVAAHDAANREELPANVKSAETESHKDSTGGNERGTRPRTSKKAQETAQNKETPVPDDTVEQGTDPESKPDEEVKQPEVITFTQPVFPPDGYVFIAGKRYNANENGDVQIGLPPGTYSMTVTCKTRCIPRKMSFEVTPNTQNTTLETVTLDWADASLTVNTSDSNLYFVAVRLDEQGRFTKQIDYLIPSSPKSFNGFNPLGNKPIKLEVYAISKSKQLTGMTRSNLEKEKSASTRVELLPGDNRSITF